MFNLLIRKENVFQVYAICCVSLVSLGTFLQLSWTSQAIPIMLSSDFDYLVTIEEASYLTILPSISTILFSFLIPSVMSRWGSKPLLMFFVVPQLLSYALIAYGASIYVFYAARILTGISDAICYAIVPVFIAEIATPEVRTSWGFMIMFFSYMAVFLCNVIGSLVSIRVGAAICSLAPLTFLACFAAFVPETPYCLLLRGREDQARQSLSKFRYNGNIDEEFQAMKQTVHDKCSKGRTSMKDLVCNPTNRRALYAGTVLRFGLHFCGFTTFISYAQLIFMKIGNGNWQWSATTNSIIFSGGTFLCVIFGVPVVRHVRRRTCLLLTQLLMGVISIVMGTYFLLQHLEVSSVSSVELLPVVGMLTYIPPFSMGIGMLSPVMLGEIFAVNIKSQAIVWTNICNSLGIIISNKVFQLLMTNFGLYSAFYFIAVTVLLSCLFTYLTVPETYKKSLDDIQNDLRLKRIFK